MKKSIFIGIILVLAGVCTFAYYNKFVLPEKEAEQLLNEGKGIFERGTESAVNESINIFNRVTVRFPETSAAAEAYYLMAQGYEQTGLSRLAQLKYAYIIKSFPSINSEMKADIMARIGRLNTGRQLTDEGVHQMLGAVSESDNPQMRSRIYTELGHVYLKQGNTEKALNMFDVALSENGSSEEAVLGKARCFKRMGQDEKAYDLYDYFLKYFGENSLFTKDIKSSYADQLYSSGYDAYKKGQYWKAMSFFSRFIKTFPGDKKVENSQFWTGECCFAMKEYGKATVWYNKVLNNDLGGKDEDALIKKGRCAFMQNLFDEAEEIFASYMSRYPSGRHTATAKKWHDMSRREMMYRIKERTAPEESESDEPEEAETDPEEGTVSASAESTVNEVVNKRVPENGLENVAEI